MDQSTTPPAGGTPTTPPSPAPHLHLNLPLALPLPLLVSGMDRVCTCPRHLKLEAQQLHDSGTADTITLDDPPGYIFPDAESRPRYYTGQLGFDSNWLGSGSFTYGDGLRSASASVRGNKDTDTTSLEVSVDEEDLASRDSEP